MEKIPTLFLRDPANMKLVTREVNPEAAWIFTATVKATVKKDGTNIRVTVENSKCIHVEKRRNPTREEKANGAEPGYIDASRDDPSDKHIFAAVDATNFLSYIDGIWSCEALGPKIQGGVESDKPCLYSFWLHPIEIDNIKLDYDAIRTYLEEHPIEGIVWQDIHHYRAVKIKRRDFGLKWPVKVQS